jgi:phage shock protein A
MPYDSGKRKAAELTARLNALAKALAEACVHQGQQAEELKKNILALRAKFSPAKSR